MSTLLKLSEVARRLDIGRSTLSGIIHRGELHVARLGVRTYRVEPEELDRYIRECHSGSTKRKSAGAYASAAAGSPLLKHCHEARQALRPRNATGSSSRNTIQGRSSGGE